jgi:hypothetical protein
MGKIAGLGLKYRNNLLLFFIYLFFTRIVFAQGTIRNIRVVIILVITHESMSHD